MGGEREAGREIQRGRGVRGVGVRVGGGGVQIYTPEGFTPASCIHPNPVQKRKRGERKRRRQRGKRASC